MSRRSDARTLRAAAVALLLGAGAGCAADGTARLAPVIESSPPRAALASDEERAVARLIALTFADRDDEATEVFQRLQAHESESAPTGLVDNSEALVHATAGALVYEDWARRALKRGVRDPALQLQLERYLES